MDKIIYDVKKEKGGRWYVSRHGDSAPIAGTFCKDKKDAMHIAADLCGINYKEYLKIRKETK